MRTHKERVPHSVQILKVLGDTQIIDGVTQKPKKTKHHTPRESGGEIDSVTFTNFDEKK